jgi:hypothetical protein
MLRTNQRGPLSKLFLDLWSTSENCTETWLFMASTIYTADNVDASVC